MSRMDQVAPFEMGVMIPNPKLDEMIELGTEKHHGHFMNSVFLFRAKGRLFDPLCECNSDDWL